MPGIKRRVEAGGEDSTAVGKKAKKDFNTSSGSTKRKYNPPAMAKKDWTTPASKFNKLGKAEKFQKSKEQHQLTERNGTKVAKPKQQRKNKVEWKEKEKNKKGLEREIEEESESEQEHDEGHSFEGEKDIHLGSEMDDESESGDERLGFTSTIASKEEEEEEMQDQKQHQKRDIAQNPSHNGSSENGKGMSNVV